MVIERAIEIPASVEAVWAVQSDVERWPEWMPTMTRVRLLSPGPLALDSRAAIKQPAQPQRIWRVTSFDPPIAFTWETHSPGLRMVGQHRITPSATGCTSHLRLEMTGVLGTPMATLFRPLLRRALATENASLRARVLK